MAKDFYRKPLGAFLSPKVRWGATLPIKAGALTIAPLLNYIFVFLKEVNPENELWFGLSVIF